MRRLVLFIFAFTAFAGSAAAQGMKSQDVPTVVKEALAKKYPNASKVSWEKERGNYEANWGGKSGEDTSVQFTPAGVFVEEVDAIAVSELPAAIASYVKAHYNGAKIKKPVKLPMPQANIFLKQK
jgi:hypothetical protein